MASLADLLYAFYSNPANLGGGSGGSAATTTFDGTGTNTLTDITNVQQMGNRFDSFAVSTATMYAYIDAGDKATGDQISQLTQSQATANNIAVGQMIRNVHGSNANQARTAGGTQICQLWVGSVTPTKALDKDFFWNTTNNTLTMLTVVADTTAPALPVFTVAAGDGSGTITVTSVPADADYDHMAYRIGTSNPPTGLGSNTVATSINLPGLTNGTTYYIQMTAFDVTGNPTDAATNNAKWTTVQSITPAAAVSNTLITSGLTNRWRSDTATQGQPWVDSIGSVSLANTGAVYPSAGTQNGKQSFVFDGSTQQLINSTFSGPAVCTEIIVAKYVTVPSGVASSLIATSSNTAGNRHSIGAYTDGKFYASAGVTLESTVAADTTMRVFGLRGNGTTSTVNVGTTATAGNGGTDIRTGIKIGANASGSTKTAMVICEILFYNRVLTDAEMTSNLNYLAGSWAATI